MSSRPESNLDALEDRVGYAFDDRELLRTALRHRSASEGTALPSNERLEFLGDSVLGFVITDFLFDEPGAAAEGTMTQIKAKTVSRSSLVRIADELGLEEILEVGAMFRHSRQLPPRICGNAVEAILGALWLDGGFEPVREFVDRYFGSILDEALAAPGREDFKSRLGRWAQRQYGDHPIYEIVETEGSDHELHFHVEVEVAGEVLGEGDGSSKKKAEQRAAREALVELGELGGEGPRR